MSTTYKTLPSNPQPSKFAPLIHAQMIPHHLCVTTPGSWVQPPNSSQFRHECINLSSHMCSCHHRRYISLTSRSNTNSSFPRYILFTHLQTNIFASHYKTNPQDSAPYISTHLIQNQWSTHTWSPHQPHTSQLQDEKILTQLLHNFGTNVSTQDAIFAHSITGHITC